MSAIASKLFQGHASVFMFVMFFLEPLTFLFFAENFLAVDIGRS